MDTLLQVFILKVLSAVGASKKLIALDSNGARYAEQGVGRGIRVRCWLVDVDLSRRRLAGSHSPLNGYEKSVPGQG